MIQDYYLREVYILEDPLQLKVGDLVTTILEEYGVVLGFGKHPDYKNDETEYCYLLIGNQIYNYLSCAIKKVEKQTNTLDKIK